MIIIIVITLITIFLTASTIYSVHYSQLRGNHHNINDTTQLIVMIILIT